MVLLTILVGSVLYAVLDFVHNRIVDTVFREQLSQTLNGQAIAYRYRFHSHINSYHDAARLFAARKSLIEYVAKKNWTGEDSFSVLVQKRSPEWFVGASTQRAFVAPRYAILFDRWNNAREILQNARQPLPEKLLHPSKRLMRLSQEGSYLLTVEKYPYMVASAPIQGMNNDVSGTLMLATPLDEQLLLASQDNYMEGIIVALVDEESGRVIASSNMEKLPPGTSLDSLPEEFLSTGQEFFEYGSSEMNFKFATLVSTDTIETLTHNLVRKVRQQRAATAFAFIASFTLIMFLVTRRIRRLSERVSEFSVKALGGKKAEISHGDQLYHLEQRFQLLTEEIAASQEKIRSEAEEKLQRQSELRTKELQIRILKAVTEALQVGIMERSSNGLLALNEQMVRFEKCTGNLDDFDILSGETAEHSLTCLHGKEHTFHISSLRILEGREILLVKDLTEQKAAEEEKRILQAELLQAQKLESIGTLAGGIAHDLNNILAPIIGHAELARIKTDPDSELAGNLDKILKAGSRAKEMVKQILTFSRRDTEEITATQVHVIVKEALKLLRASIPATIEFREDIDPDCGSVLANPTQIHQILMNLCTNAYHAMRETGGILGISLVPLEVTSREFIRNINLKPGKYIRLEVSDTGQGMDEATRERIFEPYFTTKAKGEGTGMGLSVIHGIIKGIGGHITVYSEPGKGSTFHVYLPVHGSTVAHAGFFDEEPAPTGTERIMLVDDEETVRYVTGEMLSGLGYEVSSFNSALEALDHFRAQPESFDLIITDMTMPKMTGDRLARKMLEIRPDIPVILCTGFSELINEESARAIGIRAYVSKPVIRYSFSRTIRNVLDGRENGRS